MIEVAGLGRRETLAEAESALAAQLRLDADQLALAAHWADLHDPAACPRRQRSWRPGGDG